ncbi:MAG: alpha/beta hydrolase, partial [Candidatus Methylomirabilis sp.]|nr:alpha/beta hydrolase [Deltaproteobacteria bacterium]
LQIHGGGWTVASKDHQALPLMNHLASHGWVCVSSNYRLSPHATFPDHLIDVKLAIKWMREVGPEYGGDPNFIVITGGSAGGHLCSLAALTANDPEYQPGFEGVDTRLRACVPFYGVYDFMDRHGVAHRNGIDGLLERSVMKGSQDEIPEEWEKASPIARIHPEAPPFFVVHGDRDSLVSVHDARHFVEFLRKTSRAPVAYAELPGAQHAFEVFASPRTLHTVNAVERFLAWVYSRYLPERGEAGARLSDGM